MRTLLALVCLLLVATALAFAQAPAAPRADLVIVNAAVWTGDPAAPDATALAVRGDRLVHVGDRPSAERLVGPRTRVIDAGGRRVVPGLIDTHVHLVNAARGLANLDLRAATSRQDLLRRVGEWAEDKEEDAWIVGRGWSSESWPDQRPPTADEIDEASGGRKTVLVRMDGHSLIASRSALEYADITQKGPEDPPGGKIGRTGAGVPDGAIYEEAMGIVTRHIPGETDAQIRALISEAIAQLHAYGITQIGVIESRGAIANLLAEMDHAGRLPLRCRATVSEGTNRVPEWLSILDWAAANRELSPNVQILGFKGYMDGSLGSRTAWQTEPYLDNVREADNAGFPLALAGSGALQELIHAAAERGLQPAVHAIGDRANSVLLDWYASLNPEERERTRPRIEHAQHLLPQDIARFASLGVIPSMQPYHKADDGRYAEQRLGPERIKTSYAFRDLLDTGAALAFGSDWPVVTANPFLGMEAAVTAFTLDGKTFVPQQSISVEEALRAYTATAAFALHSERWSGALRPGMVADFAILEQDVLEIDPDRLGETRAALTVLDGQIVRNTLDE